MDLTQPEVKASIAGLTDEELEWPAPVSDAEILWIVPDGDLKTAPASPAVPTPAGLTLSGLLESGVTLEWHEAVAIVLALADEIVPERARAPVGGLPSLEAIILQPDGRFLAAADRSSSEPITLGFGRLLRRLLQDKPAPANLWLLAWATSETEAPMSLEQMVGELARLDRPAKDRALVDLYERGRGAPPSAPQPIDPIVPVPAAARAPDPVSPVTRKPLTAVLAPLAAALARVRRYVTR